jgi:methionyl-tRNA formyltransferase
LEEAEQDESRVTYAPLVTRDHARIDWSNDAQSAACHIRAFDDSPGAWTLAGVHELKLFRPMPEPENAHHEAPGTVLALEPADAAHGMLVACGRGAVWVREVQPSGKRRMTTIEWIRGRGVQAGDLFV